jgi:diguanylate cyclase (GGDEF)-like protein
MIQEEKAIILIVDDAVTNLIILRDILKSKYKVVLAKSGSMALELAIKQPPDLILLDIIMADMDGYQVLSSIKNNELLKDIPVIFISALGNDEDEEKGLVLGAVDYITKPFSHAIVLARINNHIDIVRKRKLIESVALLDFLTEIPNRRNYDNRLFMEWRRAIREKKPISLMTLDIDFFKQFNDNYGHPEGDKALKKVAIALSNNINRPADFAARIGGEEFSVLLPNTSKDGARHKAEVLRASIEVLGIPHHFSAVSSVLTMSIGGITFLPDQNSNLDEFIDLADKMLYRAKNEGRNTVVWY